MLNVLIKYNRVLLSYNDNELLDLLTLIYIGRDHDAVSTYKIF
ncbi:Uncharacterised protein [Actinobacillus equuli]|nr:Uncharacterised protein [Actinobacillus equuli]